MRRWLLDSYLATAGHHPNKNRPVQTGLLFGDLFASVRFNFKTEIYYQNESYCVNILIFIIYMYRVKHVLVDTPPTQY